MSVPAPRWPGLDGLRALAVAAVVLTHFEVIGPGGAIGVDLFFVISGFLITGLILTEHDRTGALSLRRFWARRALRLFPALGAAIGFGLVVALAATPSMRHATWVGLPWVLLYVGNWAKAMGSSQTLGVMVHTWSLAVEEQYYVLWPLLCAAWICRVAHRQRAAAVVGLLALADCAYLIWAMRTWGLSAAYYRSDTHAMGLLAGSALALLVHQRQQPVMLSAPAIWRLSKATVVALCFFVLLCVVAPRTATQSGLIIVFGTVCAVVLVTRTVLIPTGRLQRVLGHAVPQWVGRRSYGIYLFHYPLALVFFQTRHFSGLAGPAVAAACIAASLGLAGLSFRYIETPFLRRKARWSGLTPDREATTQADFSGEVRL